MDKNTPPLDIAHVACNVIIENDKQWIWRVIEDDGGSALGLARKLTGTKFSVGAVSIQRPWQKTKIS